MIDDAAFTQSTAERRLRVHRAAVCATNASLSNGRALAYACRMAAGSSMFDSDEATVMEGAVRRGAQPAPSVFRSRMMDPVSAAYHPVPAVYDAADEGEDGRFQ